MRVVLVVTLWVGVAFADVAPREACRSNADCVMAAFPGCCESCCPAPRQAWLRSELERQQRRCAVIDCAPRRAACPPCLLEPEVASVAVCSAGRCVAQEVDRSDPDFCASDSDCVSSTFAGCCGSCCPVAPFATTRARAQAQQRSCAQRSCARPSCEGVACAQMVPSPIRPVCRANRCVAERTNLIIEPPPPPLVECRADSDCGVDLNPPSGSSCWSSSCGCCPSPRAVPVEQVRPPPVRRAPSTGAGSPFGLSQGDTRAAPSCSACPTPARAVAGCVSGRCQLRSR